jgi:hypothetical protein
LDRERPSAIDHGFLHPYDLEKTPCLAGSAKGSGTNFSGEIIAVAEKVIFLRLLKNAQMQGPPAFAEAASRRQAISERPVQFH